MYQRYAENRGWKVEVMDASDTGIGRLQGNRLEYFGQRRVRAAKI
jgi:protein subunit release factor A